MQSSAVQRSTTHFRSPRSSHSRSHSQYPLPAGPWAGVLIITAGWTGARWGELLGLQRHNIHLDDGFLVIDPDIGALHEVNGHFSLGPPKTAESARTITLPSFLTGLLRAHLATHTHNHVFVTAEGEHPRRSNFAPRAMRPAADGNTHLPQAPVRSHPIQPGLTFHGLRHSHKPCSSTPTSPKSPKPAASATPSTTTSETSTPTFPTKSHAT